MHTPKGHKLDYANMYLCFLSIRRGSFFVSSKRASTSPQSQIGLLMKGKLLFKGSLLVFFLSFFKVNLFTLRRAAVSVVRSVDFVDSACWSAN